MLLKTKGKALNIDKVIVSKVTRDINKARLQNYIYLTESLNEFECVNLNGLITPENIVTSLGFPVVFAVGSLDHLSEDDIVSIGVDGNVNTIYRVNSPHNTIMATERCNSNCLMCSQPPKDKDDVEYLFNIYKQMIPLVPKDCMELGISGGEPTLMGIHFFELLELITEQLPNTEVHILTNGRIFAWNEMAYRVSRINNPRLMFGIPVYSDFYQTHDYIVQAENAFHQTILGIQNLSRYDLRVEIRVVLHKLSIPRLVKLSKFIYKNMPYVSHVAFMGLEYIGYTPFNIDKLWIDPYEYKEALEESVLILSEKGIHTSIYNTPLCLIPEKIWGNNRKSISDWKNEYLEECQVCTKLDQCGGFFRWNLKKTSNYITPFN